MLRSLHFAANLSWLFPEVKTLPRRVEAAAHAGFQAVEVPWPYDTDVTELKKVLEENGMEIVLINTPPGNKERGELGLGAHPQQQAEFRRGLDQAVQYAKIVKCKRIHLMAGRFPMGLDRATVAMAMEATFIENLKYAADILSTEGILGLIEPINTRITDSHYFLNTPHQAMKILRQVDRPNLKLQLDLFHCQIMDGNLTQNITNYFPLIGHIQVAQVPNRNEPDSPGEIDYNYVFSLLEGLGYEGYIGCEYNPKGNTVDGLGWLKTQWMAN
ncbi:putative hydroxypyruvate isomerase [Narcine bancroftii]|uniref:putative hydroxypyruvate isomerase n=1 Tax=Narcine bancroftii TaxID=1343680 RepID=UPI0038315C7A